jgi:hypothetical protein
MAAGDLTLTHLGIFDMGTDSAGIKSAVDAANLAAVTDTIHFIPMAGRDTLVMAWKVEREA